jgi:hypothetical protein
MTDWIKFLWAWYVLRPFANIFSFKQPAAETGKTVSAQNPEFPPKEENPGEHLYGGNGTIHRTGTVDIQINDKGKVVRVWFRCLNLPFTVSTVEDDSYYNPEISIEEIRYTDGRKTAT